MSMQKSKHIQPKKLRTVSLLYGVLLLFLPLDAQTVWLKNQILAPSRYDYPISNSLAHEISFCIVDLKFDGDSIKICEFGEGLESRFKGYEALQKGISVWSMLWNFLKTFNLPVWFAGKSSYDYGMRTFAATGGKLTPNLHCLKSNEHFQDILKNCKKRNRRRNEPAGIVIARSLQLHTSILKEFKAQYPQMILLGYATNKFVRSKYHTNKLFEGEDFAQYKPKFKICEKKYTPTLASSIIAELGCDLFVIKPIDAALGNGVLMVEKNDLDNILRILLKDKNELEAFKRDISYYYWKRDQKEYFVIEEYAPSKIIYMNKKPYDPTMRVMFTLHNWAGNIGITYFDAYWKLPIKSLIEEGSLTEKHKSHIGSNALSSVAVSNDDFEMVKALLNKALPGIYLKMLKSYSHFNEPAV